MKAWLRLTFAVVLLAGLAVLPSTAVETSGILLPQPGPSKLQCAQFCAIVLCVYPQTCGLYSDANGQIQCGCHDSIGEIEG